MNKFELYLSLGSNIGERKEYLEMALTRLNDLLGCSYVRISSFLETEPWGFDCADKFINAVVVYELDQIADEIVHQRGERILDICKEVEMSLGRSDAPEYDEQGNRVYHSRTIDIDILFMGADRIESDRLSVPHRLIKQRDFVMVPLREVASDYIRKCFPEILG